MHAVILAAFLGTGDPEVLWGFSAPVSSRPPVIETSRTVVGDPEIRAAFFAPIHPCCSPQCSCGCATGLPCACARTDRPVTIPVKPTPSAESGVPNPQTIQSAPLAVTAHPLPVMHGPAVHYSEPVVTHTNLNYQAPGQVIIYGQNTATYATPTTIRGFSSPGMFLSPSRRSFVSSGQCGPTG